MGRLSEGRDRQRAARRRERAAGPGFFSAGRDARLVVRAGLGPARPAAPSVTHSNVRRPSPERPGSRARHSPRPSDCCRITRRCTTPERSTSSWSGTTHRRARHARSSGLVRWPQDVDLLGTGGAVDRRPERTELALARLRRAQKLDPRSVNTAVRFSFRLLQERQYDEAQQVADRGLELAATNLLLLQTRVMAELGKGDAAAARAAGGARGGHAGDRSRGARRRLSPAPRTCTWVLDSAQQRLVLDLPPAAFDNSRSAWALVRAKMNWHRGDIALARAWADTAARELAREVRAAPGDPRPRVLRGVALGFRGDSAEAVREGEAGIALIKDFESGIESAYLLRQLALVYLLAGDGEKARATLDRLLAIKQHYSAAWLGVDPAFAEVRQN